MVFKETSSCRHMNSSYTILVTNSPKLIKPLSFVISDVVQTLIDCKAKVDIKDQDGRSPLHW